MLCGQSRLLTNTTCLPLEPYTLSVDSSCQHICFTLLPYNYPRLGAVVNLGNLQLHLLLRVVCPTLSKHLIVILTRHLRATTNLPANWPDSTRYEAVIAHTSFSSLLPCFTDSDYRPATLYWGLLTTLGFLNTLAFTARSHWPARVCGAMVYCGKPSRGCQMCRTRRIKVSGP